MDPFDQNNFGNEWKRAMANASVPPPPPAWGHIEYELDRKNRRPLAVPFWQFASAGRPWAVAAGVGLLLAVGWLFLAGGNWSKNKTVQIAKTARGVQTDAQQNEPLPQRASAKYSDKISSAPEQIAANTILSTQYSDKISSPPNQLTANNPKVQNPKRKTTFKVSGVSGIAITALTDGESTGESTKLVPATEPPQADFPVVDLPEKKTIQAQMVSFGQISPKAWRAYQVAFAPRYVFYSLPQKTENTKKRAATTYWAGLGFMPASFNSFSQVSGQSVASLASQAGVSFDSPPATSLAFTSSKQSVAPGSGNFSKGGASFVLQISSGVQLGKHWSLETGLSYLRGNSTYNDYFRLSNANTSLDFALSNNKLGNSGSAANPLFNNSVVAGGQSVSNIFQFVQVPLQAGYTIWPAKKLSYTLLTGVLGSFMVKNTINANTYTAAQAEYNAFNVAATTGVRLNYRVSQRWAGAFTGTYQQALGSENTPQSLVQTRPRVLGAGVGLRYSF